MNKRLILTLCTFVLWTLITVVGGNLSSGGEKSLLDGVTGGIGWTWVAAASFIRAVVLWQGWRDVGLHHLPHASSWRLAWLPMVYIIGGLTLAIILGCPPASVLLLILINAMLVGFSEELMFRGALLQAFRNVTTIWPAILLTSAVFGAIHSLNVFITGDLKAALIQSSAAFLSGFVFLALRLRTGSLWPAILIHGLWDFATFTLAAASRAAAQGSLDTGMPVITGPAQFGPILFVLPNAIYGLWLLRHVGKTDVSPR